MTPWEAFKKRQEEREKESSDKGTPEVPTENRGNTPWQQYKNRRKEKGLPEIPVVEKEREPVKLPKLSYPKPLRAPSGEGYFSYPGEQIQKDRAQLSELYRADNDRFLSGVKDTVAPYYIGAMEEHRASQPLYQSKDYPGLTAKPEPVTDLEAHIEPTEDYYAAAIEYAKNVHPYAERAGKTAQAAEKYESSVADITRGMGVVKGYQSRVEDALARGDWQGAGELLRQMAQENLTPEERTEVAKYIDHVTSNRNLYGYAESAGAARDSQASEEARMAKNYILDLADRGNWEELYTLMHSPEGAKYKRLLKEGYGINADSPQSREQNYMGLVSQLEYGDEYGFNTLSKSGESYKTLLGTTAFTQRAAEEVQRASKHEGSAAQMDSFTRAQTAYYVLDQLYDELGFGTDTVVTADNTRTRYLLKFLEEECGVDLTGLNASNGAEMIRKVQEEQGVKADLMNRTLKGQGYDTEVVRQYMENTVQQGLAEEGEKAFKDFWANASVWEKIGMNILSVPHKVFVSPLAAASQLGAMGGRGSDTDDPNSYVPVIARTDGATRVRTATDEDIDSGFWSFVYNAGMSAADSAANALAFGKGATFFMSLAGAGDTANEILARGGSREQALRGGIAAGAIEAMTEHFSIDQLLKGADSVHGLKSLMKSVGQQALTEGSEEMSSEILNIIVDSVNMGNLSHNSQAVAEYMGKGMGYNEARSKVLMDNIKQVAESGLSGAVSGSMSATAYGLPSAISGAVEQRQLHKAMDLLGKVDERTDAYTISRALHTVGVEFSEGESAAIIAELETRGKSHEEAQRAASILNKAVKGERLTSQQRKLLQGDKETAEILRAVVGQETASAESTAVDDNPATHTAEEMQRIEEYKNAADSNLLTFVQRVRTLKNQKYRSKVNFDLGAVSERQARDVEALTGVNVTGYSNGITGGAVDHIDKRHGVKGEADRSMSDDADISRLGYVLQNYDTVELVRNEDGTIELSQEWQNKDQSHAQMVRFSKKVNGTYYVVEAAPDSSRRKLQVVSAYMRKKADDLTQGKPASKSSAEVVGDGSPARLLNIEANETSPQLTPETPAGKATSVKSSVPQYNGTVNSNFDSTTAKITGVDETNSPKLSEDAGESVESPAQSKETVRSILSDLEIPDKAVESFVRDYEESGEQSGELYARGMAEAFLCGFENAPKEELTESIGLTPYLTERQRNYAYELGKAMGNDYGEGTSAAPALGTVGQKSNPKLKGTSRVQFRGKISSRKLTQIQETSIEVLDKLAEALGIKIYLYESQLDAEGKPVGDNGWYDQKTGHIHIDLNSGEFGQGTMLFTAAHELTHYIRQWSKAKFDVLADFLVKTYGEKGISIKELVRRQQEKARLNGRTLDYSAAYEEMVADSMESMLSDGAVVERIAELRAKDKGLAEKIRFWLNWFAVRLRKMYGKMKPDTVEGRLVQEMAEEAEQLKELFAEALADAADHYEAAGAEKNTTDEGGVIKYSFRNSKSGMANDGLQPYSKELREIIESQGNVIVDSYDKLVAVVNRVFDNPQEKATAYFGTLDYDTLSIIEKHIPNLPQELRGSLFKKNRQYSIAATFDGIRHLVDEKKLTRDDVLDYLDRLADTIIEHDSAYFSYYTDSYGKKNNGILFKKQFSDGVLQSFDIVSHKKKRIALVTLYLERGAYEKKKSAKTLPMQNTPAHTPTARVGQTSNNNIPHNGANSNTQNNNSGSPHSARGNLTTRSILTKLDPSTVDNELERKHLVEYQENSRGYNLQRKLHKKAMESLEALSKEAKPDKRQMAQAKAAVTKAKNRMDIYGKMLEEAEYGTHLRRLINREVKKALSTAVSTYGAIPAGENAATDRVVEMPTSMDGKTNVSRVARSAAEAVMTPKDFVPMIEEAVVNGMLSYDPDTNKAQVERAHKWLEHNGWEEALFEWITNAANKKRLTKDDVAKGIILYNNLANQANAAKTEEERIKLGKDAIRVLSELQTMVTEQAQALQAMRIMKKQAPEMQYFALQKSVKKIEEEMTEKLKKKLPNGIQLNETLVAEWMDAIRSGDENRIEAAEKALYRDIAAQIPVTFREKWNSWRYLAMLLNPRTHIRNILGNAGFVPVRMLKDSLATGMEAFGSLVSGGRMHRTKAALNLVGKADRALLSVASGDYKNVEALVQSGGKYNDNANDKIMKERRMFKQGWLEGLRKLNEAGLDNEDVWFSKSAYAMALAGYLKANGITAEQMQNGMIPEAELDRARSYAILEAAKATYRDTNEFSAFISKIGRHNTGNQVLSTIDKVGGAMIEGVLPFKKTPANILVRGVGEYSPIGLLRGVKQLAWDVPHGNRTAAEGIDMLASGFTGSVLLGLGIWLCSIGLISGVEDDEEKREFEQLMGNQNYALNLGEGNYTIDWLAPEALPVFVGVEIAEAFRDRDGSINVKTVLDALSNISEPILEMSMLSSLNDLLDDISYSDNKLMSILSTAATNYLTQFVPSIFGSIERTTEDRRYTTYADKDHAFLQEDWQFLLANLGNKAPGEYKQIPFVDAWGREEDTGEVAFRLFSNFISPGYYSETVKTPVDDELIRLYDLGHEGVFPQRVKHSYKISYKVGEDTVKRYLSPEEYISYAKTKGQTGLDVLCKICDSSWYGELDDATKADTVEYAYSYANEIGKSAAVPQYEVGGWEAKAIKAKELGISPEVFIHAKVSTSGLTGLKDEDGKTVSNSKGLLVMREIYKINGLTDEQRKYLFAAFEVGKTVIDYSQREVDRALKSMGIN